MSVYDTNPDVGTSPVCRGTVSQESDLHTDMKVVPFKDIFIHTISRAVPCMVIGVLAVIITAFLGYSTRIHCSYVTDYKFFNATAPLTYNQVMKNYSGCMTGMVPSTSVWHILYFINYRILPSYLLMNILHLAVFWRLYASRIPAPEVKTFRRTCLTYIITSIGFFTFAHFMMGIRSYYFMLSGVLNLACTILQVRTAAKVLHKNLGSATPAIGKVWTIIWLVLIITYNQYGTAFTSGAKHFEAEHKLYAAIFARGVFHPIIWIIIRNVALHFAMKICSTTYPETIPAIMIVICSGEVMMGRMILLNSSKGSYMLFQICIQLSRCLTEILHREHEAEFIFSFFYKDVAAKAILAAPSNVVSLIYLRQVEMAVEYISIVSLSCFHFFMNISTDGGAAVGGAELMWNILKQIILQLLIDSIDVLQDIRFHGIHHTIAWKTRSKSFNAFTIGLILFTVTMFLTMTQVPASHCPRYDSTDPEYPFGSSNIIYEACTHARFTQFLSFKEEYDPVQMDFTASDVVEYKKPGSYVAPLRI